MSAEKNQAPVALFVYSRPEHTRRTLAALAQNQLASETQLYIFADGPRSRASADVLAGIKEVRAVIRQQDWCGTVEIVESETNRGLAESIVSGVTQVCREHGRVIVLEDDLETSPGFLRYMNDALGLYAYDDRVMQISGFNVRNRPWASMTGFLRVSTSWGWATWNRAWQQYDNNAEALLERVRPRREEFDLDGYSFHFEELERNVTGDLKTWAVRWYASIFLNRGLCLYPRKSLVRNLGFDGTGENCKGISVEMTRMLKATNIPVRKVDLLENSHYLRAQQAYYLRHLREWTKTRFRDRLWRRVSGMIRS